MPTMATLLLRASAALALPNGCTGSTVYGYLKACGASTAWGGVYPAATYALAIWYFSRILSGEDYLMLAYM